ncbi:hypothetical protein [Paenibacillus sp.]|nr:hypothetical protein [Paenibacillus sp.]HZG57155.1 hypothetical protein [Paenibacillus sp.]
MKEEAAKPKPRRIVLAGMLSLLERICSGESEAQLELAEAARLVETFD